MYKVDCHGGGRGNGDGDGWSWNADLLTTKVTRVLNNNNKNIPV